jgi:hypothetical protein
LSCGAKKVTQISTGQAGPHVNRDLEILFDTVNKLIDCVTDVENSVSPGVDLASGGDTARTSEGFPHILDSAVDLTLGDGLTGTVYINPSAAINVTLGEPGMGPLTVVHYSGADFDITLKNPNADTIGTIKRYQYSSVPPMVASTGEWAWPTGIVVVGSQGSLYIGGNVIVRDDAIGVKLKDTAGHWWTFTVLTTGALTSADSGTVEEAPTEPVL